MKKNSIFTVTLGTIVIASICFYCYLQPNSTSTSKLIDANIEALAAGEGNKSCNASAICYKSEYNYETGKWENVAIGSVGCTGEEECSSGSGYVTCDGITSSCV